ncbi:unnamed protein product [Miscanthus lutarioriparius]|uniref:Uncharacterized protein n=1 Tax=Miscanthus lutarioriparius TaxID=422564 RepID=A0A811RIY6_9POAL|nr:unnamed protein product [Miscanthus lutarioriparius]
MSGSEAPPPPAAPAETSPSSARKEELLPVEEKISELSESQSELLGRLRGLKEDLLSWRSNLDSQVTKYKVELSDIKSALNNEIEQLRSVSITSASCKKSVTFIFRLRFFGKYCLVQDFQELRTTLKKQQEDVSLSLKNLGLQDATENDANKGNGEDTNEVLSANLGNLKLDGSSENYDESRGSKEDKVENTDTADFVIVDKATKEASSTDEQFNAGN